MPVVKEADPRGQYQRQLARQLNSTPHGTLAEVIETQAVRPHEPTLYEQIRKLEEELRFLKDGYLGIQPVNQRRRIGEINKILKSLDIKTADKNSQTTTEKQTKPWKRGNRR